MGDPAAVIISNKRSWPGPRYRNTELHEFNMAMTRDRGRIISTYLSVLFLACVLNQYASHIRARID